MQYEIAIIGMFNETQPAIFNSWSAAKRYMLECFSQDRSYNLTIWRINKRKSVQRLGSFNRQSFNENGKFQSRNQHSQQTKLRKCTYFHLAKQGCFYCKDRVACAEEYKHWQTEAATRLIAA